MKRIAILAALALAAAACGGKKGSSGAPGVPGPVGPVAGPPQIASVFPPVASAASVVEVHGSGFSSLPAQNRVFVDGTEVTVLTATSGLLTISGLPPVGAGQADAALTVEVQGRASNAFALPLAPAGTERPAVIGGLQAPQALAVDPVSGDLYVFDAPGVMKLDPATKTLSVVIPVGPLFAGPAAGAIAADGTIAIADGNRVITVAADGTVHALAAGLSGFPFSMTYDAAGDLFLLSGANGTNVDEIAANGTLVHPFATVPGGDSITQLGGALYVTDPSANAIHKVALPGGAVSASFVTDAKLSGVGGLTASGADLIACVPDVTGDGAVRVNVGTKAVTSFAPPRPVGGPASHACAMFGGALWSSSTFDGGLDTTSGTTWTQGGVSFADDANAAVAFDGDRLFLSAYNRCLFGTGSGAVVEARADGSSDVALAGVCAVGMAWDGSRLLVVDSSGGAVKAVDPDAPGTATTLVPAGSSRGYGIAATASGASQGFYVALAGAPAHVAHDSAAGATQQADVFGGQIDGPIVGVVAAGGNPHVFAATADGIWAVSVDATGNPVGSPARLVGAVQGFSAISSLGDDGGGGVWFLDSGEVYDLDATGAIRWVADTPSAAEVDATPWGELLYTTQGSYPTARLL